VSVEMTVAPAPERPLSSIVIPVHNRSALTRACLDTLLRQGLHDSEIIVVDDGSTPSEAAVLDAYGDRVRVVRPRAGFGFAAACNAGAAAARGGAVILLNNDVLPLPGWLDALERFAATHPRAGIVGARLLWPDRTVQHAGVMVDGGGYLRHLYAGIPGDHPVAAQSRRVRAVTGAAMLVRRSVWDELGGLVTDFRNSFEDVDLCLRAGELGYEVHVCGDSVLMHLESASRGAMPYGDAENFRRLTARWGRLEPDDLSHYAADGLVSAREVAGRIEVVVDPVLGYAAPTEQSVVETLLTQRSQQVWDLRRETLRMRAEAADPWAGLRDPPPIPRTATVIVACSDHGELAELLDALEQQTAPLDAFDVIVVNPGLALALADATALTRERRLRVHALEAAGGRAATWNRGIRAATGEVVILLADDFVPAPELVAHHLRLHREDPATELVGIGPARFPDNIRRDPFARWIEDSGSLFGVSFPRLTDRLPGAWFYCANTSAKRAFLLEAGCFDERFPDDAGDDAELGFRLRARGMRNAYLPGALALHEHPLTLGERCEAVRKGGRANALHDSLYPRPHAWNTGDDERSMPSRMAIARAWLRQLASRREADRATYYERLLERERLSAYRRAVKGGSAAPSR
jgi:GT2 family glycosyltransferase